MLPRDQHSARVRSLDFPYNSPRHRYQTGHVCDSLPGFLGQPPRQGLVLPGRYFVPKEGTLWDHLRKPLSGARTPESVFP